MATQDKATRLKTIIAAFQADGFKVQKKSIVPDGLNNERIGLFAEHRTARNYGTRKAKRVYYLEGSPDEIGFSMGYLAEDIVHLMTEKYIDQSIWEMITGSVSTAAKHKPSALERNLHDLLIEIVNDVMKSNLMKKDNPKPLQREIQGIVAGCIEKNSETTVTENELWVLNCGFDCILAHFYTRRLPKLSSMLNQLSLFGGVFCNSLALINGAAQDGPLFGRDFMFPTGGIFQDTACLTITNPLPKKKNGRLPTVSMNAPGMVGSIAAMNLNGVAAGVDVTRGANSDSKRPGLNSLLLVRHAIENGHSIELAVEQIIKAQRGVTWLYPIAADGGKGKDRACVVEAGVKASEIDYAAFPKDTMESLLPKAKYLMKHPSVPCQEGAMVRWEDFVYPREYNKDFNGGLWRRMLKQRYPDAFTRLGYINRTHEDKNCPGAYYFAPLRGLTDRVVIATNHCICPEMRLCAMNSRVKHEAGKAADDSQWRYDELNHQTLVALRDGPISYEKAKALIDYLSPYGKHPHYYAKRPKSQDGLETVIGGSVSLFDLSKRTIESHFGYYCDEWIKLTLPNYIIPG